MNEEVTAEVLTDNDLERLYSEAVKSRCPQPKGKLAPIRNFFSFSVVAKPELPPNFDPYNPDTMKLIVEYLIDKPVEEAKILADQITTRLSEANDFFPQIDSIVKKSWEKHRELPDDNPYKKLYHTQYTEAVVLYKKLKEQTSVLEVQKKAVEEASAPIMSLASQLGAYYEVAKEFSTLRKAASLIATIELEVEENQHNVATLMMYCRQATAALGGVKEALKANELAHAEVRALTS